MTRSIRFHPLASAELVEAQLWYEDRGVGLGDRFLGAVRRAAEEAGRWPNVGTPSRIDPGGTILERKIQARGFPYVLVYRSSEGAIEILAVHHDRRRPMYWANRTTG